jgi:hypothetical protein
VPGECKPPADQGLGGGWNVFKTVLTSKRLTFNEWADWFLERRSKPPFRSVGNHQQNVNALKFLRPVFGELSVSEINAETV